MYKILKVICVLMGFKPQYLQGRHFLKLTGFGWCLKAFIQRNILRLAPPLPFPASYLCRISNPNNLVFHPDDLNNFQSGGGYYQNFDGLIKIGEGSYIAPNVGVITANHDLGNLNVHLPASNVVIGIKCWIGMNSVILPGVELGDNTIVGAGSVVTKSFKEGCVVLAGNPARIIKKI